MLLTAGSVLAKATILHGNNVITWTADKLPDVNTVGVYINTLNQNYTPIPVSVVCDHHEDGDPNDYDLKVDITEIAKALNEDRTAKPQITIFAKFPDTLDRDLLADRLEEALKPLVKHYQDQVERRKAAIMAKRKKTDTLSFWEELELSSIIALFPPLILVLLALDFIAAMKRIPALILAKFTTDELTKLDAELAEARATVKAIIRKMKIEPLA
jgi:hypothetical protein